MESCPSRFVCMENVLVHFYMVLSCMSSLGLLLHEFTCFLSTHGMMVSKRERLCMKMLSVHEFLHGEVACLFVHNVCIVHLCLCTVMLAWPFCFR